MPRRYRVEVPDAELRQLLEQVSDSGEHGPSLLERFAIMRHAREQHPAASETIDQWLLYENDELRNGLLVARGLHRELKAVHERLTAPPWSLAVFLRSIDGVSDRVLVACNGTPRAVGVAEGVAADDLVLGDEVLLSHDLNVVMQPLTPGLSRACDIAEYRSTLADGRLLLTAREIEVVVHAAGRLDVSALRSGDRVRWDPALALALECVPRPSGSNLFLMHTPDERFEDIGGLDRQIARLQQSVRLHVLHPDLVQRYHLRRATSVLLVGPPGTGKTMVARALARWVGEASPAGCSRFMHIKPAALHSMWYGQSESNYREAFRLAREAGATDPQMPVVMFFDEVDAIGMTRHEGLARVDDRVLTSFMAELDGLEHRGNILVVAATNRRESLDPALLRPGRLGDLVLEIPRPTMRAARAILRTHLPESAPYGGGEEDAAEARRTVIDAAVSRLYAPNGEGDVASIMFRDGARRAIQARELVSGAMLAQIARVATERAALRELETGERGIRPTDMLDAVVDALDNAVGALTPINCHAHVSGLPQDLTVVRVEPVRRRAQRSHRFMTAA